MMRIVLEVDPMAIILGEQTATGPKKMAARTRTACADALQRLVKDVRDGRIDVVSLEGKSNLVEGPGIDGAREYRPTGRHYVTIEFIKKTASRKSWEGQRRKAPR